MLLNMYPMKKKVLLFFVFKFCVSLSYAQGDDYYQQSEQYYQQSELLTNPTVQAPDVAAFQKVNFIPVSNYTGRANISIPIFTVTSGNITVPISLSYNSSGVKVNDIPSSVGSNWSLNAGGVISKVVKGMEDFHAWHRSGFIVDHDQYSSKVGFLFEKYHTPVDSWWDDNDLQPDLFLVSAPGLNTKYIHKKISSTTVASNGSSGDVFELTGQQNRVVENIGAIPTGYYHNWQQQSGTNSFNYVEGTYYSDLSDAPLFPLSGTSEIPYSINGQGTGAYYNYTISDLLVITDITITSNSGLEYTFDKKTISQTTRTERARNPKTNGWENQHVKTDFKVESYHLSKIKDFKTNKEVTFEYEEYKKASYDPIDRTFFYNNNTAAYFMEPLTEMKSIKYPKLQRLKRIVHELGSIEFTYGINRLDALGEKALSKIIIKDINGLQIKSINMVYGYSTNNSYASSHLNKRLRLDEVYTSNTAGDRLPSYKLSYNSTALPPRGSWGKDFLGYHNGTQNASNDAKPIIFFYPDQGLNSFLPISIGGNNYQTSGDYYMTSNSTYAKAGILEKITYPTGGFSEFEYELNQFKINGAMVNGGGLRVKSQKIKDEQGNEQILDYEYKKTDNSSSGTMVAMPNFVDIKVNSGYTQPITPAAAFAKLSPKTYRVAQTQAEFTNNSFVGYSRVVVKNRVNNGYTEYKYNSPENYPDLMHEASTGASGSAAEIARNNGKRSSTYSKEVYRGQLIYSAVYNSSGQKLKENVNTYSYKKMDEISFDHKMDLCALENCYDDRGENIGPKLIEHIKIPAERYLLTGSQTTNFLNDQSATVTKQITYDEIYPRVKINTIIDGSKQIKNMYYYGGSAQFTNQNRRTEMTSQYSYNTGPLVFVEKIKYHDFGNGIYLPNEIETAKGYETPEIGATITKRDAEGNILEYKTKDNVYTSFIYGFGHSVLLAKIENSSYSTAISKLPVSINYLQTLDSQNNESTLLSYFSSLRNQLPKAKVVSYTYIPSVGISTITDNRGKTLRYVYDDFHRLTLIKDQNNHIVKRIEYNYKNQ